MVSSHDPLIMEIAPTFNLHLAKLENFLLRMGRLETMMMQIMPQRKNISQVKNSISKSSNENSAASNETLTSMFFCPHKHSDEMESDTFLGSNDNLNYDDTNKCITKSEGLRR